MSVNPDIVDRYIEYRAWLIRYENRVVRDVLDVLVRGEEQAIGAITTAFQDHLEDADLSRVTPSSWRGKMFREKALNRVRASLNDVFPEADKSLRKALTGLTTDVQDEFVSTLEEALPEPALNELEFSRVPERQIANMLDDQFGERLEGSAATFRNGIDDIKTDALRRLDRTLEDGVRDGVGMRQMVANARKAVGVSGRTKADRKVARDVASYVRTQVQTTANDVAGQMHRENDDIVRGEQYIATLDTDTCPICGPLDGQVFGLRDRNIPRPPRHPNCRCFMSPVLKDWREMGLPDSMPRAAKRALNGKPANKTEWSDWVQRNPQRLERVLGPGRADLIESGQVTLGDLATTRDVRTLEELRQRRAA